MKGRGTDALLKSGRFRAGGHKVKKVIPWPQDFCTITTSKQPMYDDLSALQWAQGMICCALDEHDQKLRANMLNHSVSYKTPQSCLTSQPDVPMVLSSKRWKRGT